MDSFLYGTILSLQAMSLPIQQQRNYRKQKISVKTQLDYIFLVLIQTYVVIHSWTV